MNDNNFLARDILKEEASIPNSQTQKVEVKNNNKKSKNNNLEETFSTLWDNNNNNNEINLKKWENMQIFDETDNICFSKWKLKEEVIKNETVNQYFINNNNKEVQKIASQFRTVDSPLALPASSVLLNINENNNIDNNNDKLEEVADHIMKTNKFLSFSFSKSEYDEIHKNNKNKNSVSFDFVKTCKLFFLLERFGDVVMVHDRWPYSDNLGFNTNLKNNNNNKLRFFSDPSYLTGNNNNNDKIDYHTVPSVETLLQQQKSIKQQVFHLRYEKIKTLLEQKQQQNAGEATAEKKTKKKGKNSHHRDDNNNNNNVEGNPMLSYLQKSLLLEVDNNNNENNNKKTYKTIKEKTNFLFSPSKEEEEETVLERRTLVQRLLTRERENNIKLQNLLSSYGRTIEYMTPLMERAFFIFYGKQNNNNNNETKNVIFNQFFNPNHENFEMPERKFFQIKINERCETLLSRTMTNWTSIKNNVVKQNEKFTSLFIHHHHENENEEENETIEEEEEPKKRSKNKKNKVVRKYKTRQDPFSSSILHFLEEIDVTLPFMSERLRKMANSGSLLSQNQHYSNNKNNNNKNNKSKSNKRQREEEEKEEDKENNKRNTKTKSEEVLYNRPVSFVSDVLLTALPLQKHHPSYYSTNHDNNNNVFQYYYKHFLTVEDDLEKFLLQSEPNILQNDLISQQYVAEIRSLYLRNVLWRRWLTRVTALEDLLKREVKSF